MIREFRKEDLPVLLEIARLAWQPVFDEYRKELDPEIYAVLVPDPELLIRQKCDSIADYAEHAPGEMLVAERDGRAVGYICFGMNFKSGVGSICSNARDPRYPGKGVANEMYEAVLQKFRDCGMLVAEVMTGLDPAHAPARLRTGGISRRMVCHEIMKEERRRMVLQSNVIPIR